MFKHSARRLLSYSLRRAQQSNSELTTASQQQATVTLVLDDKPVTLNFGDESKSLQSFLDDVNSHQSEESSHYNSATNAANQLSIDPRQSLGEIFAATNNICLQSTNSNKQLVITRPNGAMLNGDTINHQELINLANELNKRLQESEVTRQLHVEANNLDNEIEPMYEKLVALEKTTNDTTDISLLAFLSVWTMSTVSIARLTWWEFSWDIMEPVAWATQAGAMLFWGWYYFITRNENSMSDLQNRIKNKKLVKKLQKNNFNTDKYNQLIQRRKEVDDQLAKFKRW